MKRIAALVIALIALDGCSASSRFQNAESQQAAAMAQVHSDSQVKNRDIKVSAKAQAAIETQTADYNRDLRYAVSLQQTPATQAAEVNLLDLQYQLTGPANTTQDQQQDVVKKLMGTVVEVQKENEVLTEKNVSLEKGKADSDAKVVKDQIKIDADDAKVAVKSAQLYTLGAFTAGKLDQLNGWISKLQIAGAVLFVAIVVLLGFWLFEKFGTKTAEAVTAVAAKVP